MIFLSVHYVYIYTFIYIYSIQQSWTPALEPSPRSVAENHSGDLRRSVIRKSEVDLGRDEEGGVQNPCWLMIIQDGAPQL